MPHLRPLNPKNTYRHLYKLHTDFHLKTAKNSLYPETMNIMKPLETLKNDLSVMSKSESEEKSLKIIREAVFTLNSILSNLKIKTKETNTHFKFNPYIRHFIHYFSPFIEHGIQGQDIRFEKQQFIDTCNHPDFLYELAKSKRSVNKNRRSVMTYINDLFEIHSKMVVIFIDLGYPNENIFFNSSKKEVNEFLEHKKRFFKDRRKKPFKGLLGYCWKLEKSMSKDYHLYALLFFDPYTVKNINISYQELVGHWKQTTDQKGGAFPSSNISKNELGIISCDDIEQIKTLMLIVDYFTKIDDLIMLPLPDHHKTFGRGSTSKKHPILHTTLHPPHR